ncbi:MAG: S9 family peptidase [Chitinophagaceae bacterium]|nr:S9 family peptidase [Chitinophagaceae bacterium]
MKRISFLFVSLFLCSMLLAQKKPLDHSVYDGWQHIGEKLISNDGRWIVYTIDPQEGDNELVIQAAGNAYKKSIPRGYNAVITDDSRYLIFKIKPFYKDTREARIKKKKPEDFPKDSLGIIELGKEEVWKTEKVKGYKIPSKYAGWVAYQLDKPMDQPGKPKTTDNGTGRKVTDSLNRVIDSLKAVISSMPEKKNRRKDDNAEETGFEDADGYEISGPAAERGNDMVLRNLHTGDEVYFIKTLEYYFSKTGGKLLVEKARDPLDSSSSHSVLVYDMQDGKTTMLSREGNDFKNFAMTDDGSKIAFLAERNARAKDLQKFYRIWYYTSGMDSAVLLADKNTEGMHLGMTVSEFGNLNFSKSGNRLFFGVAPIQPPKDTTIIEIDKPKLDIWHYNDDYLQTVQTLPARLRAAQQENYLAVYNIDSKGINYLGSKELPQVLQTNEGDGDVFAGVTDYGKRVQSQWLGTTLKDVYAINVNTGEKKLVKKDLLGQVYTSSTGKYIMWYDRLAKHYFTWDGDSARNISARVKAPLFVEDWDTPAEPQNYGVMKWLENDEAVFIYDRYGIWKIDPQAKRNPQYIAGGRERKVRYRYLAMDPEERFIIKGQRVVLSSFSEANKKAGLWQGKYTTDTLLDKQLLPIHYDSDVLIGSVSKASKANSYIFTMENFTEPGNLYHWQLTEEGSDGVKLTSINPQQKEYNWGRAELFSWKAYNGKQATGVIYKPEDFNPAKKYPVVVYFYEKESDEINDYREPAPIRSAINIPFFVSRGYIIFVPDIEYKTGYPGKSAYDYIVSGTRALVKLGFADSTNMALQGHSWGGYQAAQVATMTKLFKAVWAGAPVANMTSAYGGIRWESGVNRQFQYEKTQSRIGGTLWEKLPLYMENSPLFHLQNVTAPMVIMANDADGAVPWYQGIELFTALRRLGKKVWMFNYNGQGHGLTQRQDMRDYQIRMQQFFDWILKGEKPAKWITEGVPAVQKGKDWGLELEK